MVEMSGASSVVVRGESQSQVQVVDCSQRGEVGDAQTRGAADLQ